MLSIQLARHLRRDCPQVRVGQGSVKSTLTSTTISAQPVHSVSSQARRGVEVDHLVIEVRVQHEGDMHVCTPLLNRMLRHLMR